jgi:hypothetical protein
MINNNVEIIDNILPIDSNIRILEELSSSENWKIAKDTKDEDSGKNYLKIINSKVNNGFSFQTINNSKIVVPSILNVFGYIIFDIIKDKLKLKNSILIRLFWNMYFPGSETKIHTDTERFGIKSALYSLHTTDGGIVIDKTFYPDIEGQVKIFNSNIPHKGLGPKKDNVRFNLNLMFTTQ